MRRGQRGATAAGLLMAALLCTTAAACDSSDDPEPSTGASTGAGAQAGAAGGQASFPVSVTHSQGRTEIPKAPARVVTLSAMDLDAALSVGVRPVGAGSDPYASNGISPWLSGKIDPATTKLISVTPDVSFEEIAALRPDLILATGDYQISTHYPQLSKIAPTLAPLASAAEDSWQDREKEIGTALGRSAEATRQISGTERVIADTAAEHPGLKDRTFSASFGYSATQIATLASPDDFAVQFLQALGLKVAPGLAGAEPSAAGAQPGILSPEQAGKLAADLVLIGYDSAQVQGVIEANPAFGPVKSNGVYQPVDTETITELRNPSILGIPWLLDELKPALAKAAA